MNYSMLCVVSLIPYQTVLKCITYAFRDDMSPFRC